MNQALGGNPSGGEQGIHENTGQIVENEALQVAGQEKEKAKAALAGRMPDSAIETYAGRIYGRVYDFYKQQRSSGAVAAEAQRLAVEQGLLMLNAVLKENGLPQIDASGSGSGSVTDMDRGLALDQYRDAIKNGRGALEDIVNANPTNDPNARDTFQAVQPYETEAAQVGPIRKATAGAILPTGPANVSLAGGQVGKIQVTSAEAAAKVDPALVSPVQRLQAAQQKATAVQGTSLDTSQADEARQLQQGSLADLQATAEGRGAGQLAAAAREKAALAKAAAVGQGIARTARGSERKGALVNAVQQATEQATGALTAAEERNAVERQQAQQAVANTASTLRTTDISQAAKKADLEAQRNQLQAQLDAAKAANDQQAILSVQAKMADLDQQVAALNATAKNTAAENYAQRSTTVSLENAKAKNDAGEQGANRTLDLSKFNTTQLNAAELDRLKREQEAAVRTAELETDVSKTNTQLSFEQQKTNAGLQQQNNISNADRNVDVQKTNNAQGLAANVAGSQQDVAQAELRIKAQEAIERSAQGLLDESERQNQIAIAREQLKLAQQRQDREAEKDWFDKLAALTTGVATIAKTATAVSDRRMKVDIKKAKSKDVEALAAAIRDSLSTYQYKPGEGLPEGQQVGVMAQDIQKTKLGKLAVAANDNGVLTVDYPKLTAILAAVNVTERKKRAS